MDLYAAIKHIYPELKDHQFLLQDDGEGAYIATWDSTRAQPTQEELEAAWTAVQAEREATAYIDQRKAEYPSVGDQLDMMYWDNVNGTTTWKDAIQTVKDKYPKP